MLDLFLAGAIAAAVIGHLSGPATVVDGDTLIVSDARIRLIGIDAPELGQTCRDNADFRVVACGAEAREVLQELVSGAPIRCQGTQRDRYRRLLATCFDADGRDIGQAMVQLGFAVAPQRWDSPYRSDEAFAKAQGVGLWATHFEDPADYRRRRPGPRK